MKIVKVKDASVLKVGNDAKYIYRFDGRDIELDAQEAYKFYNTLEGALSSTSINSTDPTITIAMSREFGIFHEIKREQAFAMWLELDTENRTGKGYWCNKK